MKLSSRYEPAKFEEEIYALWEKQNAFAPHKGGKGYFSIAAPPPNANASLHLGYALTMAIEDALVRYHRMSGKETLFIPGADHAGFETWVVYEKQLNKAGKTRFDFSREELYRQIWDFVEKNKHNFMSQLRILGASFDWSKFTYTLDNKVVETAYETFQKMWQEGLIYRGSRVVNFCTFHGTSFSDIEIVHEEENTKLWHIAYPLVDGSGEVVIATTRPETKLGQAALMVHPSDKRYKNLVGKEVIQPLVPAKPIKIIADKYVDEGFGTGVVTVTPAHDINDFEVAQRHHLPATELITIEGKISDNAPEEFRGLSIVEARKLAESQLKEKGFLRKVEDYRHSVAKCYKCATTIEPLLREQWFVKMRPLAEKAVEALNKGKIKFYPSSKLKQVIDYLENVKDWNISRQIAWGIPIPAFQNTAETDDWIFSTAVNQETLEVKGQTYKRDPDVFDTWFSSGQWPYATLNYPGGEDFKTFYPLSLMETGGEILFQWVARMIVLGLYRTGEIPFKDVYIHGNVLTEDGQKMSKSLGNAIDPFELIDKYGSDALRMGLLTGRRAGVHQGYHPAKIIGGRNFANKLWNIARYVESQVGDNHKIRQQALASSRADHWILAQISKASQDITKAMENYRVSEAYELLYNFVWHDLADWYIEASKHQANNSLLAKLLENTLKITHPFAPFLTETIWQTLSWDEGTILAVQNWPGSETFNHSKAKEFETLIAITAEARSMAKVLDLKKAKLHFKNVHLLSEESELVRSLGGLGAVEETKSSFKGLRLTNTEFAVWLEVGKKVADSYMDSLETKQKETESRISSLSSRLSNDDYIKKAPEAVVADTKHQLKEEKTRLEIITSDMANFQKAARNL